jgi:peptide/nickel transport system permease protein
MSHETAARTTGGRVIDTTEDGAAGSRETEGLPKVVRTLLQSRTALFGLALSVLLVLAAVLAPWIAPYRPDEIHPIDSLMAPSARYWLGTDDLGRDILSRIIFGARVSLMVGTIAIGIISIPAFARITRANVLSLREKEFVEAARALGGGGLYLAAVVILPNCLSPIIVQASLGVGNAILVEAALSFLGLGVQPPEPSWGSMLAFGRSLLGQAPWYATFSGLSIFVTVLALNFLGDGLREALDPRLRSVERGA